MIYLKAMISTAKTVHLAAGCFWGAEKYFSLVDGVLSTRVGYANGRTTDPKYEEVYTDKTGFAETVRVVYDPDILPLGELLRLYFAAIDPVSLNRQGGDEGTRYRTGIYYSDPSDLPAIRSAFDEEAARHSEPLAVEVLPLENFYDAEDYHQSYLDKNPGGYCHIPNALFTKVCREKGPKKALYREIEADARALTAGETDPVAVMAELSAVLYDKLHCHWAGFYRVAGSELVLGPFQGPVACLRIPFGRGVCGTAWKERRTIVVPDVDAFPGHIACSALSRSEIVAPLFAPTPACGDVPGIDQPLSGAEAPAAAGDGAACCSCAAPAPVIAVLDIDSRDLAAFDSTDALCLEHLLSSVWGVKH